jgi:hypothetical protein
VCVCVFSLLQPSAPPAFGSLFVGRDRSADKETDTDTEIQTRMLVLSRCLSLSSSLAVLSKLSALHLSRRLDRAP